ncbi:MAG TPA: GTPase RsgA [Firmicutes bacterium]|nr:GTPase RsgA [Bacillota bacterium]
MKKCQGCGIEMQTDNPEASGYVPQKVFERADVCQRCYRLTHYKDLQPSSLDVEVYEKAVEEAVAQADTVFLVLDTIDFESSLHPAFERLLRRKRIIGVLTKIDLLPAITSEEEAIAWAKRRVVYADNVVAVSGKKGWGIEELSLLRGKVTAVVGTTNCGKSTLVKRLVEGARPTISTAAGTTLNNLTFEDESGTIIDTPGLWPKGRLLEMLCSRCASSLVPDKKITSKLFDLKQGQGISLGGILYLNLKSEKPLIVIAYASEGVEISRVSKEKVKDHWQNLLEQKKRPPCNDCQGNLHYVTKDIRVGNEDLVIPGLGWLSFRHAPAVVEVVAPDDLQLKRRSPLVGPKEKSQKRYKTR